MGSRGTAQGSNNVFQSVQISSGTAMVKKRDVTSGYLIINVEKKDR